jgi:glycosyltransferase involved in cell wall biosynthesis
MKLIRDLRKAIAPPIKKIFPWTNGITKKIAAKRWSNKSIVLFRASLPMVTEEILTTKGASGSDASVVFLSQIWAKLGYEVTVFSNTEGLIEVHDGVQHIDFRKMNWYDEFNVLIICRNPSFHEPQVKAKSMWLEWQDIPYPEVHFIPKYLDIFDRVFAKSYFQKDLLPSVPDEKFVVIPNGYDESILALQNQNRDPYKLIYASRYYRGLEPLLRYGWKIIQEAIPEATLHLYYGFTARDYQPETNAWREEMIELIANTPGVTDHGLVGHKELMQAKATAAIQYYPCNYPEVDCVSVREASIVGCVPVTTDAFVFSEKDYCVTVPGDPDDPETHRAIARYVVELLQNPDQLQEIREKTQNLAQAETWKNVAERWLEFLPN